MVILGQRRSPALLRVSIVVPARQRRRDAREYVGRGASASDPPCSGGCRGGSRRVVSLYKDYQARGVKLRPAWSALALGSGVLTGADPRTSCEAPASTPAKMRASRSESEGRFSA